MPQIVRPDLGHASVLDSAVKADAHQLCVILLGGRADRAPRATSNNEAILRHLSRLRPVYPPGGVQEMGCLERRGLACGINSLSLSTMRADLRPRMAQFQWEVAMAADSLLVGEGIRLELPLSPMRHRELLTRSPRLDVQIAR